MSGFSPKLLLGRGEPSYSGSTALRARATLLLRTRPGELPWMKDFGCDLGAALGHPATPAALQQLEGAAREALARFMPDVEVTRCEARRVSPTLAPEDARRGSSALLPHGAQTTLTLLVELRGPGGATTLTLPLGG